MHPRTGKPQASQEAVVDRLCFARSAMQERKKNRLRKKAESSGASCSVFWLFVWGFGLLCFALSLTFPFDLLSNNDNTSTDQ